MAIACASASAKPGIVTPLAYSSPLIASAPLVTATSSQFVARNYNGFAAAPIAYTSPLGYASPYVASPYVASPYVASPYVASPYAAAAYSPYYANAAPIASVASVAPLKYTAAPVLL